MKFLLLLAAFASIGLAAPQGEDAATKDEVDPVEAFNIIDVDGSRKVSADELEAWMSEHGQADGAKGVRTMIAAFDMNGDGEVNLDEGLRMYKEAWANKEGPKELKIRYI